MSSHCMVIPGEWSSADGRWNFIIDKDKMSRIVPVRPGMNLSELKTNVTKEFFTETEIGAPPVLSYWPPNTKELVTGVTTPPVIMTNDGALAYFFLHLEAHRTMNMFVTFEAIAVTQQRSQVAENPLPFTTPNQPIKSNLNPFRPPSTASSKIPSFSLFEDDDLIADTPTYHPLVNNTPPHFGGTSLDDPGPPKKHRFSLNDETLSCGDEMLEQMFKEDPDNIPDSWLEVEDEDTPSESSQPPDTDGVPPAAYDHDFWDPLLDEHLGASDVAEVMAGIQVPKTAPHIIHCTTGNAFDHTVLLSGEETTDWKKDLNFHGVHQRERPHGQSSSKSTSTPHSDGSTRTPYSMYTDRPQQSTPIPPVRETRPLSEISDEEFDVPPLFDDISYEADDVPDLNFDDPDEEPTVGKLYASKQDCQIALAIYAIKERFHFRQTRTTRHSFVLSCHDTHCDWRILAQELTTCGYYTIKKANLVHICPFESRDLYKRRATSKVIAHVYRSRYGEPNVGPKSAQLQQMVLEDLRVSASYMKCHRAKGKAIENTIGNPEESYLDLASYFERLKATNPDTVTAIETELDNLNQTRFLYAFLSFGASIHGFRRVRPVLIIDGTHLSGKYKGVLLTASGQDGNFQVSPPSRYTNLFFIVHSSKLYTKHSSYVQHLRSPHIRLLITLFWVYTLLGIPLGFRCC